MKKILFTTAFVLGLYGYLIYFIGSAGLLYKPIILSLTIFTLLMLLILLINFKESIDLKKIIVQLSQDKTLSLLIVLLLLQTLINLVGVLGPELAFDSLWYHLTLPKIYLLNHKISFIPGGLLYYSVMPKLTEMLYIGALSIQGEILAKFIHFSFGILTSIALYTFSKQYFNTKISLLITLIFYSNLVVGWESITAYIDLSRTFFEFLALWSFVIWFKERKIKWFVTSTIMVGLAVSTKLLAFGSFIIFEILIAYYFIIKIRKIKRAFKYISAYLLIVLLIISPWLLFSYYQTGNPLYPLFANIYKINFSFNMLLPLKFIKDTIGIFIFADDPLNPTYLMFLPIFIVLYKKFKPEIKLVSIYSVLAFFIWYFTPRTGGGRFILPYLPAFSLIIGEVLIQIKSNKLLTNTFVSIIVIISVISIGYRAAANCKFLPVLLGKQTRMVFLAKNLNFKFADFYDTDNYFIKTIGVKDNVLLYGFHNLYYVNFSYIHESWIKKGDKFNFVAIQNVDLPIRFNRWKMIYENKLTGVKLYTNNKKMEKY